MQIGPDERGDFHDMGLDAQFVGQGLFLELGEELWNMGEFIEMGLGGQSFLRFGEKSLVQKFDWKSNNIFIR